MPKTRRDSAATLGMTRREFARHGLAFLLALGGIPLMAATRARAEGTTWVTDVPGSEALLRGVQYVPKSAKPDQNCGNCVLFQAQGDQGGKCALFQQGLVPTEAWCISWGPRPS